MAKGKYDETLNLPSTEFPMRANLPNREPEILKFCKERCVCAPHSALVGTCTVPMVSCSSR